MKSSSALTVEAPYWSAYIVVGTNDIACWVFSTKRTGCTFMSRIRAPKGLSPVMRFNSSSLHLFMHRIYVFVATGWKRRLSRQFIHMIANTYSATLVTENACCWTGFTAKLRKAADRSTDSSSTQYRIPSSGISSISHSLTFTTYAVYSTHQATYLQLRDSYV